MPSMPDFFSPSGESLGLPYSSADPTSQESSRNSTSTVAPPYRGTLPLTLSHTTMQASNDKSFTTWAAKAVTPGPIMKAATLDSRCNCPPGTADTSGQKDSNLDTAEEKYSNHLPVPEREADLRVAATDSKIVETASSFCPANSCCDHVVGQLVSVPLRQPCNEAATTSNLEQVAAQDSGTRAEAEVKQPSACDGAPGWSGPRSPQPEGSQGHSQTSGISSEKSSSAVSPPRVDPNMGVRRPALALPSLTRARQEREPSIRRPSIPADCTLQSLPSGLGTELTSTASFSPCPPLTSVQAPTRTPHAAGPPASGLASFSLRLKGDDTDAGEDEDGSEGAPALVAANCGAVAGEEGMSGIGLGSCGANGGDSVHTSSTREASSRESCMRPTEALEGCVGSLAASEEVPRVIEDLVPAKEDPRVSWDAEAANREARSGLTDGEAPEKEGPSASGGSKEATTEASPEAEFCKAAPGRGPGSLGSPDESPVELQKRRERKEVREASQGEALSLEGQEGAWRQAHADEKEGRRETRADGKEKGTRPGWGWLHFLQDAVEELKNNLDKGSRRAHRGQDVEKSGQPGAAGRGRKEELGCECSEQGGRGAEQRNQAGLSGAGRVSRRRDRGGLVDQETADRYPWPDDLAFPDHCKAEAPSRDDANSLDESRPGNPKGSVATLSCGACQEGRGEEHGGANERANQGAGTAAPRLVIGLGTELTPRTNVVLAGTGWLKGEAGQAQNGHVAGLGWSDEAGLDDLDSVLAEPAPHEYGRLIGREALIPIRCDCGAPHVVRSGKASAYGHPLAASVSQKTSAHPLKEESSDESLFPSPNPDPSVATSTWHTMASLQPLALPEAATCHDMDARGRAQAVPSATSPPLPSLSSDFLKPSGASAKAEPPREPGAGRPPPGLQQKAAESSKPAEGPKWVVPVVILSTIVGATAGTLVVGPLAIPMCLAVAGMEIGAVTGATLGALAGAGLATSLANTVSQSCAHPEEATHRGQVESNPILKRGRVSKDDDEDNSFIRVETDQWECPDSPLGSVSSQDFDPPVPVSSFPEAVPVMSFGKF